MRESFANPWLKSRKNQPVVTDAPAMSANPWLKYRQTPPVAPALSSPTADRTESIVGVAPPTGTPPAAAPSMVLTARQVAARIAVNAAFAEGCTKQLINLPTGTGKTVLACFLARKHQTLFLCHRQELVAQTAKTMSRVDPAIRHGFIMQGRHEIAPFTIGMIQTVYNRLDSLAPDQFSLVIIDEAHHASAKTWRAVADHFTPKLRIGLSATPERTDGAPLSNLFDRITYSMNLADAVNEGMLVKPVCIVSLTGHGIEAVHTRGGDFVDGELAEAVNTPSRNRYVVEKYQQHASARRSLCFTAGVQHAKDLAKTFQVAGIDADWISGDDPLRREKLADFAANRIQVMCNAMILTEGFDDPGIDAVLLARPTKSRGLYAQMIGRGLRLAPGKDDCLLIDYVDNAGSHNLVTAWKFLGKPPPLRTDVPEYWTAGNEGDRTPKVKVQAVETEKLVDILKPPPTVDAFAYGKSEWHYAAATERQIVLLSAAGYDTKTTDWTRGQASAVIGNLPASSNQVRLLLALGYDTLNHAWSRAEAGMAIEAAARREHKPDWNMASRLLRRNGSPMPATPLAQARS